MKTQEIENEKEPRDIEEIDDSIIRTIIPMSKTTWKHLGEIALNRETSRAALVRQAIKQYLKTLENPEEQNPKIPDRQLDKILEECTEDDGDGFEIEGENGFIEQMKAKGFKLRDLTPEQWKKLKEHLQVGYQGYFIQPEPEEFAEKFAELEPSEEQRTWLSTAEEETED